ncbi:MAG: hypothetical protein O3C40_01705 [Planctomycetota bacterium]|nr:hypothetical protein [Planctomycetota bacterium]
MSMPHNFADDPNSFPGPPAKSSNTTVILIAIAIIGGTLMLICGGVIFGVVMTVRQAQQDFEIVMNDQQWQTADDVPFQDYSRFVTEGRYSEALESVNVALESNPDSAFLRNNKAWLLATCPDDAVRDGKLAIEHATKACELSNWINAMFLDTLAAAYAETGDFESAVKWQKEAIRLDNGAFAQDFQKRLRLFKAGKPYREGVPPYQDMGDEPLSDESPVEAEFTDPAQPEATEPTTTDEATPQQDTEQP